MDMNNEVLIFDFGSQYTQLIARRIRELRYSAKIVPFYITYQDFLTNIPQAVIFSGGPASVYTKNSPKIDKKIFNYLLTNNIPILGICYGMQMLTELLGGKVQSSKAREFGYTNLILSKENNVIFRNISPQTIVWMSHGDKVTNIPPNFETIAYTTSSEYAAVASKEHKIYALQFHPEVHHTKQGKQILKNFCQLIAQLKPNWTMKNYAKEEILRIKQLVGKERVLLGVSGGVDSMVTAKIIHEAIGNQLSCVYIDNGLMRENETKEVETLFNSYFKIPLHIVRAEKIFLENLKEITDPEQKRKIIGRVFIEQFKAKILKLGKHEFFAQGTLYPDVIESVSVSGSPSDTIKSHHNRVQEVMELIQAGKVIEPLKELFKDEVRRLGLELKMPREILYRHPFPGPGLAIRILGDVTQEKLNILRKADTILINALKEHKLYDKVWQAFAVFLPIKSVGVMGDQRTYENAVAIRLVESIDGMTANFAKVSLEFLNIVSSKIINEVSGINRVVYDISSKPPSTIEWE